MESQIGGTLTNHNSPASTSIPVVCLYHTTRRGGLELVSAISDFSDFFGDLIVNYQVDHLTVP